MTTETNTPPPSPEAQLEAIYAKQFGEEPKATETPDPEEQADEPADTEDAVETQESDDAGPAADDDSEEVEYLGKQYKLPKDISGVVKKAGDLDRDYTQKTQELANLRRIAEDRGQFAEFQQQVMQHAFKEAAEVQNLQSQIQQYDSLDWNSLVTSDPQRAMALNIARQQLQTQLTTKQASLSEVASRIKSAREQHDAKQMELGSAELTRRLGKLTADDSAAMQALGRELGFDTRDFMSPAALHALSLAAKYSALQKAKPGIEKRAQQARPMGSTAARTSVQSAEAAKVQDLKQRAQKSGAGKDAEAYLASLFAGKRKR